MLEVTMIRCATLLIRWGESTFLTDPWFKMHMRGLPCFKRPGRPAEELPHIDGLLVSHLHADHWDADAVDRLQTPPTRCLLPPGALDRIRRRTGVDYVEVPPWTATRVGEVTIHAVPGPHTFPPPDEVNYVVDLPKWGRVFFGGDSRYDKANLQRIADVFAPIHLALLPVGGTRIFLRRTTMGPRDAYRASQVLGAQYVVPIHEGGRWPSIPPASLHPGRGRHLARMFARRGAIGRVCCLEEGESAVFPGASC